MIKERIEIEPNDFITFTFDWDSKKSNKNYENHKLSFEDAIKLFKENFQTTIQKDAKNVDNEDRQEINFIDHHQKMWRFIFVIRKMIVAGFDFEKNVVRVISCHRQS